MARKETSNTAPISGGKHRHAEPVVKTGINEVKPPISPSSDLGVSFGSEEEDGWGRESEGEPDAAGLYCVDLFT